MTPALDRAIRTFVGDGVWYRIRSATGIAPAPDRARDLLMLHSERKVGLVGFLFAPMMAFLIWIAMPETLTWFLAPVILVLLTTLYSFWLKSQRPDGAQPQAEFLGAIISRLHLAPVHRRYAEALAAVYTDRPTDTGRERLTLLRHLAEEEERLLALVPAVTSARSEEVAGEAELLRARLAVVRDPAAREALTQGLVLAERRLVSVSRGDEMRERLEAHQALLHQASQAAIEGILGQSDVAPGLDGLRENVAALGREVAALEAAVQEMRTL